MKQQKCDLHDRNMVGASCTCAAQASKVVMRSVAADIADGFGGTLTAEQVLAIYKSFLEGLAKYETLRPHDEPNDCYEWPPRFHVNAMDGLRLVLRGVSEGKITVERALECFSAETGVKL